MGSEFNRPTGQWHQTLNLEVVLRQLCECPEATWQKPRHEPNQTCLQRPENVRPPTLLIRSDRAWEDLWRKHGRISLNPGMPSFWHHTQEHWRLPEVLSLWELSKCLNTDVTVINYFLFSLTNRQLYTEMPRITLFLIIHPATHNGEPDSIFHFKFSLK